MRPLRQAISPTESRLAISAPGVYCYITPIVLPCYAVYDRLSDHRTLHNLHVLVPTSRYPLGRSCVTQPLLTAGMIMRPREAVLAVSARIRVRGHSWTPS